MIHNLVHVKYKQHVLVMVKQQVQLVAVYADVIVKLNVMVTPVRLFVIVMTIMYVVVTTVHQIVLVTAKTKMFVRVIVNK